MYNFILVDFHVSINAQGTKISVAITKRKVLSEWKAKRTEIEFK